MKNKLIILMLVITGCKSETTFQNCNIMSSSVEISSEENKINSNSNVNANWAFSYDPLVLPFSIKYNPSTGFSISHSGEKSIITPLGIVGIQYSFNSKSNKEINGHSVSSGDFLVALVDRTKETKQLFKIEDYKKLKVITNGKTIINAESGYVEIDVTEATIDEIKFIDNSKFSIVNKTTEVQNFKICTKNADGSNKNCYECEIEPNSYKVYPAHSFTNIMENVVDMFYEFKLENNDENSNETSSISRDVNYGEVYYIENTKDKKSITLTKKTN